MEEELATFAGGCFWCMAGPFQAHKGVSKVISGYAGGTETNPTYAEVSAGKTSHREAIQVTYDPQIVSYEELLEIYWWQIDPTDADGQFVDRGFKYSTAIWYHTEEQKTLAEKSKQDLEAQHLFDAPIVTEILPYTTFFAAEQHHQDYANKHLFRYKLYANNSGREQFKAMMKEKKRKRI